MTDKRIKMDCPFCGEKKDNIQLLTYGAIIVIRCPKCSCEFHGQSKQEVINRWNCRTGD